MKRARKNSHCTFFGQAKRSKVYAVAFGNKRGIFSTWDECQEATYGVRGAVYKSFHTRDSAQAWLDRSLPKHVADESFIQVFCDGSCRNKVGGVGVYFGPDDPRNVSERLPAPCTNQRAELTAIIRVLEATKEDKVHIFSDSEYGVLGINYRLADMMLAHDNRDLWIRIGELIAERETPWVIQHVKGHEGNEGNVQADRLAGEATK